MHNLFNRFFFLAGLIMGLVLLVNASVFPLHAQEPSTTSDGAGSVAPPPPDGYASTIQQGDDITLQASVSNVNFRWDPNFWGGSIIVDRCITGAHHWLTSEEISPNPRPLGSWPPWPDGPPSGSCMSHYPVVGVIDGDILEIGIGASDTNPGAGPYYDEPCTQFWRVQRVGNGIRVLDPAPYRSIPCRTPPPPPTPEPTRAHVLEAYNDPGYKGELCYSNSPETANIHPNCNDRISSIRLKSGWSVRLYRDTNQGGPSRCLNTSDTNLADNTFEDGSAMDNGISSFVLYDQADCPARPNNTMLDVRYVDQVYVQKKGEVDAWGNEIWNHCGPASIAMILHYEGKETRDVLYDRQATLDLVCAVKLHGCTGASSRYSMRNVLQQRGLQASLLEYRPSFAQIKQSIQNGHPVILGLKKLDANLDHFVVATGYRDPDTVIINDPFGGFEWWYNWELNTPYTGSPKRVGENVTYTYSNLPVVSAIIVSGPAPARQVRTARVDASGGSLTDAQVHIEFAGQDAIRLQTATQPVNVTYTPALSPTHDIYQEGFDAALTSFTLEAFDQDGQSIDEHIPYTMTIDVDPSIVEDWGTTYGQFPAITGLNNTLDSTLATTTTGNASLVVAGWDKQQQDWTIIPSVLDEDQEQIIAQWDTFTEIALLVAPPHVEVQSLSITGPTTGTLGASDMFTVTTEPAIATTPITYTWQATDHTAVYHTGDETDTMNLNWNIAGTKLITVTASNGAEAITATHEVVVSDVANRKEVYLPLIQR
jgi:hypothetical protein